MKVFSNDSIYNCKLEWHEREAKIFAFWAVVTATIAVISAVVVLPILYTSVHYLHSEISQESDFCRLQIRDFWIKWYSIRMSIDDYKNIKWIKRVKIQSKKFVTRSKRHWLFGKWISPLGTDSQYQKNLNDGTVESSNEGYDVALTTEGNGFDNPEINNYGIQVSHEFNKIPLTTSPNDSYSVSSAATPSAFPPSIAPFEQKKQAVVVRSPISTQSSTCLCQCQYGPQGPAGELGDNGKDGSDGIPGTPGENGRSGDIIITQRDSQKEPCIICPPGHTGPPGPQGSRGPPGPRGSNGLQGSHGSQGEVGMQGPPGPIGASGAIGPQGSVGVPGRQFMRDGARGPPGKPGPLGPKGLTGCQGTPGGTVTGPKGAQGDPGRPGHDGHKGIQGIDGVAGAKGASGDCFHCPIPRTPPGY